MFLFPVQHNAGGLTHFYTLYSQKIFALNSGTYFSHKAPAEYNVCGTRKSYALGLFLYTNLQRDVDGILYLFSSETTCLVPSSISLFLFARINEALYVCFTTLTQSPQFFRFCLQVFRLYHHNEWTAWP